MTLTKRISEKKHQNTGNLCACFNLRKAMRTVTHLYDEALKPAGLRATQFTVLASTRNLGPVSVNQLAEKMVMDRTTLTRNLKPLERDGLIAVRQGVGALGVHALVVDEGPVPSAQVGDHDLGLAGPQELGVPAGDVHRARHEVGVEAAPDEERLPLREREGLGGAGDQVMLTACRYATRVLFVQRTPTVGTHALGGGGVTAMRTAGSMEGHAGR